MSLGQASLTALRWGKPGIIGFVSDLTRFVSDLHRFVRHF
jgi:hypothetical protein